MSAGKNYGTVLYWGTMLGSVIVLLGSLMGLMLGLSWMPLQQQYDLLLSGQQLASVPLAQWRYYASADGVILIGLGCAILSLVPAILGSLPRLWRSGARLVAVCGLLNAALILGAVASAIN